jgi:hypothetical protein
MRKDVCERRHTLVTLVCETVLLSVFKHTLIPCKDAIDIS